MTPNGLILPISEMFYSLQGEGRNVGRASYFIRLAGCNVACSWCDSKESWQNAKYTQMTVADIITKVLETTTDNVVITGGEPTMYNLLPLTSELKKHNINVCLETSGTHEINGIFDWICLSPKPHKPPKQSVFKQANELKVIIFAETDFVWATKCAELVPNNCLLFLQPEWNTHAKKIDKIVDFIKANPKWKLSLQTHKFIDIP